MKLPELQGCRLARRERVEGEIGRDTVVMVRCVEMQRAPDLAEIVDARRGAGLASQPKVHDCGRCHKEGNDGRNNEQLLDGRRSGPSSCSFRSGARS